MPRSPWSMAGEALVTVVLLVGPAVLAYSLGWPLDEHTDWTWLWQYLRGGRVPDEAVIAALAVALWAVWAVHLAVVALDVVALLRGLVPRIGLVRLVWVLVAGGATATSSHTAAVAAQTDALVQVPVRSENAADAQGTGTPREQQDGGNDVVDRARNLAHFGFDSAALTPEMKRSLEPTVGLISDFGLPGALVTVTGHTDPVGDPDYNLALSERRAREVADYLAQHLGEEVEFRVQGVGSAQPPPDPRAPYGEHRRVEIAYTLQPPAAASEPAPSAQAQPEEATGAAAEPEQEQVRLDVTTASEQESGPDPVLVGAVAGAAGLGAGYAAGRRRASGGRARPSVSASVPEAEAALEEEVPEEPVAEGLLRDDPGGLANGVIDQDGYVLVADTVRVDGRDGLSFTGTHAAGALRAVVADHNPGPVIATRAVLAALGGTDTAFREVQEVADLHGARLALESALLTAARRAAEEDEAEASDQEAALPRVLVVCEASDLDQGQDLREAAAAAPGAVVFVLGNRVDRTQAGTGLCCEDIDRVRVVSAGTEAVRNGARLRYRGPLEAPEEDHEDTSAPGQSEDLPEEDEPAVPVPAPPVSPGPEPTRPRVGLRLFSEQLAVEVEGQEVPGLRTVGRTLLAYLALHSHGASAEEIAQTCFAAMDSPQAVSARKNAIASIRSSLRAALKDPDHHIIVNSGGRYSLDPEIFSVDLWSFSEAYKEARRLSGQPRADLLREVVDAHSEKLLNGMEEVWAESARKSCVRVLVESLLAIADEARGEEEQVALLERACVFDEFNEPLYQRIMEVHVSQGRPEIAHQVYRSLKDKLSLIGEKPSSSSRMIIEGASKPAR
ncbi:OmpA family protein [Nocardiopsis dassonvillei]|uniref:OmpA family protein n=1 Tax=Nocardiopsis dassonvillei TaxID=2014 RepID=UPI0033C212FC